jgi:glutathione S-transferase
LLSWLMFVATGVGPFSGQAVHFTHMAPEKLAYAQKRYAFEAHRHYTILDEHLAKNKYMVGGAYSIVDMDVWGWARMVPFVLHDKEALARLPNLKRLVDEIEARPSGTCSATSTPRSELNGAVPGRHLVPLGLPSRGLHDRAVRPGGRRSGRALQSLLLAHADGAGA